MSRLLREQGEASRKYETEHNYAHSRIYSLLIKDFSGILSTVHSSRHTLSVIQ